VEQHLDECGCLLILFSPDSLLRATVRDFFLFVTASRLPSCAWQDDKLAVTKGSLSVKYEELIAVGVAVTTQCPDCIEIHTANALRAGATAGQLA